MLLCCESLEDWPEGADGILVQAKVDFYGDPAI